MTLSKLKTVYVVEDTVADRTMMSDFLSQYSGVKVRGFFSGDACIKEIVTNKEVKPELIVIDYFLDATLGSKLDGLDVVVKLSELSPQSTIVMFTSIDNERVMELAKEKGAKNYFIKGPEGFKKLNEYIRNNFDVS